jgi:hypothetical protein
LQRIGRPPLPECPIEAAKQGKEPKQPCFVDSRGYLKSLNWKQWQIEQPLEEIVRSWFCNPKTGIGTLGGWNGKHWLAWVDFDQKDFASPQECDHRINEWEKQHPTLATAPMFRTPSGGYRFLIAFDSEPQNFKANSGFSLDIDGKHHVGELLTKNGGHTLLPPTRNVHDKPYTWQRWVEYPPVFKSPEDVGLYPLGGKAMPPKQKTQVRKNTSDTTLSDFLLNEIEPRLTADIAFNWHGHDFKQEHSGKVKGGCPWHDSKSGTAFYAEQKGDSWLWRCPACDIGGGVIQYRHRLKGGNGSPQGRHFVELVEELASDTGVVMPEFTPPNNHSSPVNEKIIYHPASKRHDLSTDQLKQEIDNLIEQDLPQSDLDAIIPELASRAGRQTRDVWSLYKSKIQEVGEESDRQELRKSLPTLLEAQKQRLNLAEFLWGDGGVLAEQMIEVSQAMPTAAEFLLTTLIPAAGSRIGTSSRIVVSAKAQYTQPAIYRTCIVAPSGHKKSPAQKAIVGPLDEMEAEAHQQWKKAINEYQEAMREFRSAKDKEAEEPEAPPSRRRFIVQNGSIESRIKIHAENPRGILLYRDEWSAHITGRNKYRKGVGDDAENELSEFNGTSLSKDVVDSEKCLYLERSAISRTGSTQPETLKRLMADHEDSTGEFARWLFCMAECPAAYLDLMNDDDKDTGLANSLKALYHKLEQLPDERDYFLSFDAKAIFEAYQHQLIDWTLAETNQGLKTAFPKFESYLARLTLWLHCINAALAGEMPEQMIPPYVIEQACLLCDYYIDQLRLIYAFNSPQMQLTGRLLKLKNFIEGKAGVTRREIQQRLWIEDYKNNSKLLEGDLKELVEAGVIILTTEGRKITYCCAGASVEKCRGSVEESSTLNEKPTILTSKGVTPGRGYDIKSKCRGSVEETLDMPNPCISTTSPIGETKINSSVENFSVENFVSPAAAATPQEFSQKSDLDIKNIYTCEEKTPEPLPSMGLSASTLASTLEEQTSTLGENANSQAEKPQALQLENSSVEDSSTLPLQSSTLHPLKFPLKEGDRIKFYPSLRYAESKWEISGTITELQSEDDWFMGCTIEYLNKKKEMMTTHLGGGSFDWILRKI